MSILSRKFDKITKIVHTKNMQKNNINFTKMTPKNTQNNENYPYKAVLTEAGLSEKESDVYEVLLENGKIGIKELLELTPYKRGDLYNICYDLEKKNLIHQTNKRGVAHFEPCDPYALKDYIEKQKQQLYNATNLVSTVLPQMLSTFTLNISKPSVRSYEGLDGLEKIYDELNKSKTKELLLFRSIYDDNSPEYDQLLNKQIKRQVKLRIKTKALTPLVAESKETYLKLDASHLVTRRIVDREKFSLPAEILVWENTVAIISLKTDIIGTIIENRDISKTFKVLFDLIWGDSESYNNQIIKNWSDVPLKSGSNSDK